MSAHCNDEILLYRVPCGSKLSLPTSLSDAGGPPQVVGFGLISAGRILAISHTLGEPFKPHRRIRGHS